MRWRHRLFTGVAHLAETKIRSCLSILGIFIGVMMSIADGVKRILFQDIDRKNRWHQPDTLCHAFLDVSRWKAYANNRKTHYRRCTGH